jgi:hypothetical protein
VDDCLLEYLKKMAKELSKFSENEFLLFKNWVINNIIKSIDSEKRNVVEKVLDESREVDKMVSNVELMLKREFKKSRDEGRREGRMEGRMEGRIEGKIEDILELLEELGDVPDILRKKIQKQNDTTVLSKWLRLAAKTSSIEEFEEKMSAHHACMD